MSNVSKLLEKARNAPNNLRFDELCKLAEAFGFKKRAQTGSHQIYKNDQIQDKTRSMINFQRSGDGKAKNYQVKQLLNIIDDLHLEPK